MTMTVKTEPSVVKDQNAEEALDSARRVLALESEAILALSDSLADDFVAAVSVLENAKGRVIVTGMGKSGHVGRKIAATLASTGAPSQFVHPAEASHGDMGMITSDDVVVALSNSGETKELSDLLQHCRRFSIPLVAVTAKPGSTLGRHATIILATPDKPEAGTMGLAPTTSTTTAMALGDALAVALLERKGFTARDFGVLHPSFFVLVVSVVRLLCLRIQSFLTSRSLYLLLGGRARCREAE